MAAPVPASEPSTLVAGDTWQWTKTVDDYPVADGWSLSYAFRLENGSGLLNITAAASGTDYAISVPAASTSILTPGLWRWASYATLGSTRYSIAVGHTTVKPNLAQITHDIDFRSSAKKAYDNALEAWETFSKSKMVTLNGRTYTARDAADLILYVDKCKADYQQELDAEQFAQTGINPRRVGVRLVRV